MTTPPKAEFVGFDRDNDMYWRVPPSPRIIIAKSSDEALARFTCHWPDSRQEDIEALFGPLTKERK